MSDPGNGRFYHPLYHLETRDLVFYRKMIIMIIITIVLKIMIIIKYKVYHSSMGLHSVSNCTWVVSLQ